ASVLVAFAVVVSVFLAKQIIFTEKVLIEKNNTIGTLEQNLKTSSELDKNVKKLRADKNLTSVRSSASDNNLDVVIDAMPYKADDVALGSSLQTALLTSATIESLSVESTDSAAESGSSSTDTSALEQVGDAQPVVFSFKATGTSEQLEDILDRLNRSIRPIHVISLQLESAGANNLTATVQAVTYYQPQKTVELKEKVVKP
ncbi:MAG: hypothetical protein Q7T74_06300, partial [Candidatus Saccharibacteria bacterium]|nr:hypothetical protein [Candidatus Saccharibacteria bacterium]